MEYGSGPPNTSSPPPHSWIYVCNPTPPIPPDQFQSYCQSILQTTTPYHAISTINAIINLEYPTPPHHGPFITSYYPNWTTCSVCQNPVEPAHPMLNNKPVKTNPFCDSCTTKMYHSYHVLAHKPVPKNKNKKAAQKTEEDAKRLRSLMSRFYERAKPQQ